MDLQPHYSNGEYLFLNRTILHGYAIVEHIDDASYHGSRSLFPDGCFFKIVHRELASKSGPKAKSREAPIYHAP